MDIMISNHKDALSECIVEAIRRGDCVVFEKSGVVWSTRNSTATSYPPIEILRIFNLSNSVKAAVSFVSVTGDSGELFHHHSTHLLALVVSGTGHLLIPNKAEEEPVQITISSGDVVVIPRGASHVIECAPPEKLKFISLEISDEEIEVGIDSMKDG